MKNLINSRRKNYNVSILGIAYKENTNSTKNAPSLDLIKNFDDIVFKFYDSFVDKIKFKNLIKVKNIEEAIINCNILVILNKSSEFKKIDSKLLSKMKKKRIIIDPFGVLLNLNISNLEVKYFTMGLKN